MQAVNVYRGSVAQRTAHKHVRLDPFVRATLTNTPKPNTRRTMTRRNGGADLEWTEGNRLEFPLQAIADPNNHQLVLEVLDEEVGAPARMLGKATLALSEFWENTARPAMTTRVEVKDVPTDPMSKPAFAGNLYVTVWRNEADEKLVVDVWEAHSLRMDPDDSAFARAQFRAAVAVLVVYFAVGMVVFATSDGLNDQAKNGNRVMNAFYFCMVIATTVGYGDVLPVSWDMKLFVSVYAVVGVLIIGFCLGIVVSYITQLQQAALSEALAASQSADNKSESHGSDEDNKQKPEKAQTPVAGQELEMQEMLAKPGERADPPELEAPSPAVPPPTARPDDAEESFWWPVAKQWLIAGVAMAIGTLWFRFFENFDGPTAFYTAVISLTTVGYGDFSFQGDNDDVDSGNGRVFGALYLLIGTLTLANAIGGTIEAIMQWKGDELATMKLDVLLTPRLLEEMDEDGSGEVDEQEFINFMLKHMQQVSATDIELVKRRFRDVDVDGSGTLTAEDLVGPPPADVPVPLRDSSLVGKDQPEAARSWLPWRRPRD